MNYILVENEKIVGRPKELPKNWANVSNFYLLPTEKLKEYGWYSYRFVEAQKNENQYYDGSDFVIEENEVVEYQKVRDKTQQEITQEITQENESKWLSIREERNQLLSESDWTQVLDSPFTELKKNEWKIYRQELRDITLQTDVFNVIWPIKPGTENE